MNEIFSEESQHDTLGDTGVRCVRGLEVPAIVSFEVEPPTEEMRQAHQAIFTELLGNTALRDTKLARAKIAVLSLLRRSD